jgi:predicted permease
MELFGIMLSIPAAFVASLFYSLFVRYVIAKSDLWTRMFRRASFVVLAMVATEFLFLAIFGAVRLYGATGGVYFIVHLVLFFLGTPALANVIVLRRNDERDSLVWLTATIPCTVLAFVLVLLQYDVSERLFGIDGVGGPYSSESR